jgi:hypothetical protein
MSPFAMFYAVSAVIMWAGSSANVRRHSGVPLRAIGSLVRKGARGRCHVAINVSVSSIRALDPNPSHSAAKHPTKALRSVESCALTAGFANNAPGQEC